MIDWIAVKKAGDKWDSVKEFFSRPDVAGASAGALIGGGLGAGLGLVTSPKKGLSAGVHGGIGALTGGLAGYGIGRGVMQKRENSKLKLRNALDNFLNKNARGTKYKYDENYNRVPDEEYTKKLRDTADHALNEVNDIYGMYGHEPIERLKRRIWEALLNGSWMYEDPNGYEPLPLDKILETKY